MLNIITVKYYLHMFTCSGISAGYDPLRHAVPALPSRCHHTRLHSKGSELGEYLDMAK